ncbi:reverse transcriptase domain-containing protein [Tanacetum coccineum]
MFKQLHINISLADALILIPKYQKMLKSLLSNKEKLNELAKTPLNENCLAVILKKLPEKLGDPGKFLIPCGFSELKCKALADLGASINLMSLSVWKKLGLPELISTQMTLELANRDICTPKGIARDVFVPVGKFTFPADFVIVDYESDPRVPLILGRPFLRTARALIDVHGEQMILRDRNERLILNMSHDTSSYSNEPHQESINMIDVYNVSHEEYREDLFATSHQGGNPTSSLTSHTDLTSPEVNDDIFDLERDIIKNFLNLDKRKDLPSYHDNQLSGNPTPISEPENKNSNPSSPLPPFHNSLSGSTTSSSPSLPIYEISDYFLEEFADELNHITFPPGNDDLPFDSESDLRDIEYLLNHDPIKEMDSILEDSADENSPNDNLEEKIKDSKILIDELDLPGLSDFLLFPECDSVFYEDFSEVDTLHSTDNEDKIFNPGILIHENLFEVTNCATPEKNVKKTTNASLILESFNAPLYELPFHKEVPGLGALLSFSSENEEKVYNPGIFTSKRVHTSLLPELSHQGPKAFKVIKILGSLMEIFPCSYQEDIRVSTSIPLDQLKKRISEKRTKNQAKTDKTEHGMEKRGKENVDDQSSGRLCNLSFLEYLKLYLFEYEHVAVHSTRHGLVTATIGKPASLVALAILVTEASQSRQHGKSESYSRCVEIIENKSVRYSRKKSIVSQVKSSDGNSSSSSDIAKLTHAVNQQTSVVTTAMTAILKQFQATPPPASVKAVEEICVTCGGPHPYYQCLAADGNTFPEYRDNIQGYVAAAAAQQNQSVSLSELEKFKKINDVNIKAMQAQINNVKNELRNEMQNSIQTSMSNQTNELKNMMASFFQMNTASTSGSGSLPSNTVANLKDELKAITTRSGLVLDGPTVPMPPPFINPEEDERVEETLTDPEHVVILKKLPEKLGDLGKFLILCGFSELKCKALADLGASINLMPLSV